MNRCEIVVGDALEVLRAMPEASVQCCVTSPPYWSLRDYGVPGQLGLEPTFSEYLTRLVAIFEEVRRVLREDGTCWVNMGDSYAANRGGSDMPAETLAGGVGGKDLGNDESRRGRGRGYRASRDPKGHGLKHKDLIGQPWRLAFALQADGWYLRSDIIWHKPNPMPESVRDRPTKAHEYVFLLSKRERYYYDAAAIAEAAANPDGFKYAGGYKNTLHMVEESKRVNVGSARLANGTVPHFKAGHGEARNARTVWTIATSPFPEAHFATFPPELPRRCILAGSRPGDLVLDPFSGAGTTGLVANRLGREFVGIELNPQYAAMARRRIAADAPLFNERSEP